MNFKFFQALRLVTMLLATIIICSPIILNAMGKTMPTEAMIISFVFGLFGFLVALIIPKALPKL